MPEELPIDFRQEFLRSAFNGFDKLMFEALMKVKPKKKNVMVVAESKKDLARRGSPKKSWTESDQLMFKALMKVKPKKENIMPEELTIGQKITVITYNKKVNDYLSNVFIKELEKLQNSQTKVLETQDETESVLDNSNL